MVLKNQLAIGGEKSFGPMMAVVAKAAGTNVQGVVIHNVGHWVMEENPTDTVAAVLDFLQGSARVSGTL